MIIAASLVGTSALAVYSTAMSVIYRFTLIRTAHQYAVALKALTTDHNTLRVPERVSKEFVQSLEIINKPLKEQIAWVERNSKEQGWPR